MAAPPAGTVTFLFTDIEGSARRWSVEVGALGEAILDCGFADYAHFLEPARYGYLHRRDRETKRETGTEDAVAASVPRDVVLWVVKWPPQVA